MILFQCTECGRKLRAPADAATKQGKCECGAVFVIPREELPNLESPTMDETLPAPEVSPNPQTPVLRARGPFKSKLLASLIVLVLGAIGVTVKTPALWKEPFRALLQNLSKTDFSTIVVVIIAIAAAAFLGWKAYVRLDWLAKSLSAPTGDEAMAKDPRPPILFLRPFEDDAGLFPEHERELTAAVAPFGPVIALGRPGEKLQTLGATRVYLEGDWQRQVAEWAEKSALIIVRIGETGGLRWELDILIRSAPPTRVLLQVPRTTSRNTTVLLDRVVRKFTNRDAEYDYNAVTYIFFDAERRPHFLKGPLGAPISVATDVHGERLRNFFSQVFGSELDRYWEGRREHERKEARRRRFVRLGVTGCLISFVVVVLIIWALIKLRLVD